MTRTGSTDGFNEEMGWLSGYEGGDVAGDGFDTAFYAEAASAREYAQRYGEDGQAQRERALKQLEGTGYEELVMQGLQAEQNSAYREKAAAFLESFMKGEYIPDVQLGELWQSAQAWKLQRTQAGSRQDTAVQTAGANTAREGLNLESGTAYNESMPNAAEGLTVGESLTEGKGYASAAEMLGEWAEGAGGAGKVERPSWRQSELDIGNLHPEYEAQKSFVNGKEVPYATKRSSRPDFYQPGSSIEVKNYNVSTRSGRNSLVNTISKQVNQRITDLPSGTAQTIMVDVRGQQVTNEVLKKIRDAILQKCNTDVIIQFMR